jgi:hypothetical protein
VRLIKATGLAVPVMLAIMAFLGVFSASAEETVLHNYACLKRTNGIYEDPHCRFVTGTFVYERVGMSSTPEKVKSVNTSEFELETTSTLIKCPTETSTGTASNPEPYNTTNGEGKATITFEGCAVSKPTGCLIPGKKVVTNELHAVLGENKTLGPGVKLTPVSGEVFVEVTFEKCLNAEFNKKYAVKGSDFGKANNEESLLEFTNASSSLTFGGSEAMLRGKGKQSDLEGNSLLALP